MEYITICITCGNRELERCPNGFFAEGAARKHLQDYPNHRVIVGYEIKNENGN